MTLKLDGVLIQVPESFTCRMRLLFGEVVDRAGACSWSAGCVRPSGVRRSRVWGEEERRQQAGRLLCFQHHILL